MNKLLILPLLLLVALGVNAAPRVTVTVSPGLDPSLLLGLPSMALPPATNLLTFTFNYDYSQAGSNGCVSGATSGCVSSFLFFEQIAGTQGPTLQTVPAGSGANTLQTGLGGSVTVPALSPGSHVFGLVAITPDLVESVAALAPAVIVKSAVPATPSATVVTVK
jgi:hypothetical protein